MRTVLKRWEMSTAILPFGIRRRMPKTSYSLRTSRRLDDVHHVGDCMTSTSRLIRCERSPRPVSVGVKTLWPVDEPSETRRQHQPPCEAPVNQHNRLLDRNGALCRRAAGPVKAAAALGNHRATHCVLP